jgi:hypothetical protein
MKKIELNEYTDGNKEILFDLLSAANVEKFEVSFSGDGDDGSIDGAELPKEILNKKVEGTRTESGRVLEDVEDIITQICYEVLEREFGGWENDSGAFGAFIFDVSKRSVTLDFNEKFVESKQTLYKI